MFCDLHTRSKNLSMPKHQSTTTLRQRLHENSKHLNDLLYAKSPFPKRANNGFTNSSCDFTTDSSQNSSDKEDSNYESRTARNSQVLLEKESGIAQNSINSENESTQNIRSLQLSFSGKSASASNIQNGGTTTKMSATQKKRFNFQNSRKKGTDSNSASFSNIRYFERALQPSTGVEMSPSARKKSYNTTEWSSANSTNSSSHIDNFSDVNRNPQTVKLSNETKRYEGFTNKQTNNPTSIKTHLNSNLQLQSEVGQNKNAMKNRSSKNTNMWVATQEFEEKRNMIHFKPPNNASTLKSDLKSNICDQNKSSQSVMDNSLEIGSSSSMLSRVSRLVPPELILQSDDPLEKSLSNEKKHQDTTKIDIDSELVKMNESRELASERQKKKSVFNNSFFVHQNLHSSDQHTANVLSPEKEELHLVDRELAEINWCGLSIPGKRVYSSGHHSAATRRHLLITPDLLIDDTVPHTSSPVMSELEKMIAKKYQQKRAASPHHRKQLHIIRRPQSVPAQGRSFNVTSLTPLDSVAAPLDSKVSTLSLQTNTSEPIYMNTVLSNQRDVIQKPPRPNRRCYVKRNSKLNPEAIYSSTNSKGFQTYRREVDTGVTSERTSRKDQIKIIHRLFEVSSKDNSTTTSLKTETSRSPISNKKSNHSSLSSVAKFESRSNIVTNEKQCLGKKNIISDTKDEIMQKDNLSNSLSSQINEHDPVLEMDEIFSKPNTLYKKYKFKNILKHKKGRYHPSMEDLSNLEETKVHAKFKSMPNISSNNNFDSNICNSLPNSPTGKFSVSVVDMDQIDKLDNMLTKKYFGNTQFDQIKKTKNRKSLARSLEEMRKLFYSEPSISLKHTRDKDFKESTQFSSATTEYHTSLVTGIVNDDTLSDINPDIFDSDVAGSTDNGLFPSSKSLNNDKDLSLNTSTNSRLNFVHSSSYVAEPVFPRLSPKLPTFKISDKNTEKQEISDSFTFSTSEIGNIPLNSLQVTSSQHCTNNLKNIGQGHSANIITPSERNHKDSSEIYMNVILSGQACISSGTTGHTTADHISINNENIDDITSVSSLTSNQRSAQTRLNQTGGFSITESVDESSMTVMDGRHSESLCSECEELESIDDCSNTVNDDLHTKFLAKNILPSASMDCKADFLAKRLCVSEDGHTNLEMYSMPPISHKEPKDLIEMIDDHLFVTRGISNVESKVLNPTFSIHSKDSIDAGNAELGQSKQKGFVKLDAVQSQFKKDEEALAIDDKSSLFNLTDTPEDILNSSISNLTDSAPEVVLLSPSKENTNNLQEKSPWKPLSSNIDPLHYHSAHKVTTLVGKQSPLLDPLGVLAQNVKSQMDVNLSGENIVDGGIPIYAKVCKDKRSGIECEPAMSTTNINESSIAVMSNTNNDSVITLNRSPPYATVEECGLVDKSHELLPCLDEYGTRVSIDAVASPPYAVLESFKAPNETNRHDLNPIYSTVDECEQSPDTLNVGNVLLESWTHYESLGDVKSPESSNNTEKLSLNAGTVISESWTHYECLSDVKSPGSCKNTQIDDHVTSSKIKLPQSSSKYSVYQSIDQVRDKVDTQQKGDSGIQMELFESDANSFECSGDMDVKDIEVKDALYAKVGRYVKKNSTAEVVSARSSSDEGDIMVMSDDEQGPPLPARRYKDQGSLKSSKGVSTSKLSLFTKMGLIKDSTKSKLKSFRKAVSLERGLDNVDNMNIQTKTEKLEKSKSKIRKAPSLKSLTALFGKKSKSKKEKSDHVLSVFDDSPHKLPVKNSYLSLSKKKLWSSAKNLEIDCVEAPRMLRTIGKLVEINDDGSKVIELSKPPDGPVGFYIGRGTANYDYGIFVSRFCDESLEKLFAGLMNVGDEVLQINHKSVRDLSLDDVYELMAAKNKLVLKIFPMSSRRDL